MNIGHTAGSDGAARQNAGFFDVRKGKERNSEEEIGFLDIDRGTNTRGRGAGALEAAQERKAGFPREAAPGVRAGASREAAEYNALEEVERQDEMERTADTERQTVVKNTETEVENPYLPPKLAEVIPFDPHKYDPEAEPERVEVPGMSEVISTQDRYETEVNAEDMGVVESPRTEALNLTQIGQESLAEIGRSAETTLAIETEKHAEAERYTDAEGYAETGKPNAQPEEIVAAALRPKIKIGERGLDKNTTGELEKKISDLYKTGNAENFVNDIRKMVVEGVSGFDNRGREWGQKLLAKKGGKQSTPEVLKFDPRFSKNGSKNFAPETTGFAPKTEGPNPEMIDFNSNPMGKAA